MSNELAPDGYRYGVMFGDGSVAERWNGRTQRDRAAAYAEGVVAEHLEQWGRADRVTLARRRPGQPWERVEHTLPLYAAVVELLGADPLEVSPRW